MIEENKPDPNIDAPTISELVGDQSEDHDQDAEINSLDASDEMMERLKALSQLGFCSQCGAVGHVDLENKKGEKTIQQVQGKLALAKTITMPCGSCRALSEAGRVSPSSGKPISKMDAEKVEFIIIPREEIDPIAKQGASMDPTTRGMLIYRQLQTRIYAGKLNYLIPGSANYGNKSILDQL